MLNRQSGRRIHEHKSIIVRTRKESTVDCFHFTTRKRNFDDLPEACNKYATFDKMAGRIEIEWNNRGDVFIILYETLPNGVEVKETVVFDYRHVTDVVIETDFMCLR